MTGQNLLDRMELLNQELQLQSGEADVTRGLLALNVAQDTFEGVLATYPDILGGSVGTVTTTDGQEYSTFPSGVLRIDALDFLDPNSGLPSWPVIRAHQPGGHAYVNGGVDTITAEGEPQFYWTNGTRIYWSPVPDGAHDIRYYGFAAASDVSAGGTFAYPDTLALPFALFAVKLMKAGIDDPIQNFTQLAQEVFGPIIKTLSNFNRDSAAPMRYKYSHDT